VQQRFDTEAGFNVWPGDPSNGATLQAIVSHYIANKRGGAGDELQAFASQATLQDAVRMAALAQTSEGKLRHQWRIPNRVLAECAGHLEAALPDLAAAPTFEALHEVVRREIRGVRGIGRLTVYDTALRIAAWRRLEPARVFLHAGTKVGARHLGLESAADSLSVEELPPALRSLRPREVEDVLCIYKDELATLASAKSHSRTPGGQ